MAIGALKAEIVFALKATMKLKGSQSVRGKFCNLFQKDKAKNNNKRANTHKQHAKKSLFNMPIEIAQKYCQRD